MTNRQTRGHPRKAITASATLLALAALLQATGAGAQIRNLARPAPGSGSAHRGVAHAARATHTLYVKDTGYLHYVSAAGALLVEEGHAYGSLPGRLRVRMNVGPTVTASFTTYLSGGSISGHGTATLRTAGTYDTFGGTLTITGGTGRYAHAHGTGGLYGSLNRYKETATVQTIGTLHY
jgi:hypothetical protein